ncbi:hypothetical protein O3M35_010032 [Rhynocoris fuscipes]|uniref:tRNA (uracil-O(2)-)-methyltransferase n=1 Tax=Rhynocoris fuscipes TaxID=488301 RepID=A0AAW1CYF4_9HEMI
MPNDFEIIERYNIDTSSSNYWKCIAILITKPYILNKYIGGCEFFNFGEYSIEKVNRINDYLKSVLNKCFNFSEIKCLLKSNFSCENLSGKSLFDYLLSCKERNVLLLRLNYPRNGVWRKDIFDLICCDFLNCYIDFTKVYYSEEKPYLCVNLPYQITYKEKQVLLLISGSNTDYRESVTFLRYTVFPKLVCLLKSDLKDDQLYSINLISANDYVVLYNELKRKYVDKIKQIWTECTNVEKFIHEDIAISTYLILLWEKKSQRFYDLGCGNGLLVYILNSEGHKGVGLDIRSRKIWYNYPSETVLKEMSITPSDNVLFPDADWIIGNHSDELTPWIPVIASRSSYKTNLFLLPCCSYEFDGRKYARTNTNKSQYQSYLDYVEEICKKCGFIVVQDRLRIPSTKRLCFVSFNRTYNESDKDEIDRELSEFIKINSEIDLDSTGRWLSTYKVREAKEKVRNCTQLDRSLLENIVNHVSTMILKEMPSNECQWNEGTPLKLSDIVKTIPADYLRKLKNECGGLQTLLKNHHHIFILENGTVKFRKPIEKFVTEDKWKKKRCWFYNNHPDSCPLPDGKCPYKHD